MALSLFASMCLLNIFNIINSEDPGLNSVGENCDLEKEKILQHSWYKLKLKECRATHAF
jgi:hypothetical protein